MTTAAGRQILVGIAMFTVVMSFLVLSSDANAKITGCECKQPGRGGTLGQGGLGWLLRMAPCPPVWRPELLLRYCHVLPCWAASAVLARCLGLPQSSPMSFSTATTSTGSSVTSTMSSATSSSSAPPSVTSSPTTDPSSASAADGTKSSPTGLSSAPSVQSASSERLTDSLSALVTSSGETAKTSDNNKADSRVEHRAETMTIDDPSSSADRIHKRSNTIATPSVVSAFIVKTTSPSLLSSASSSYSIASTTSTATTFSPSATTTSVYVNAFTAHISAGSEEEEDSSLLVWPCLAVLDLLGRCRAIRDLPCPALQLLTRDTLQACPNCSSTTSTSTQSFPSSTLHQTAHSGVSSGPALNVSVPQGEDRKVGGERTWTGVGDVEVAGKVAREATLREPDTEEGHAVVTGGRIALIAIATCFALVWCVAIGLLITYRCQHQKLKKTSFTPQPGAVPRERPSRSRTRHGARIRSPD